MIDPAKVMIVTPTHDGNVCCGYASGIATCANLFAGIGFIAGNSDIGLVRAMQAHLFLQTQFDHLLSIDADIQFSRTDLELLYEGDEDIACAEYVKKDGTGDAARYGLGFVRIHRSVFDKLRALTIDNTEHGKSAPMVGDFIHKGTVMADFFPSGPNFSGHWLGEDNGFFHLCEIAKIATRVEKRTRLVHWGRMSFVYQPQTLSPTELPVEGTMPSLQPLSIPPQS